MVITSETFDPGGQIPQKYTCDGDNINPPLVFADIPPEAVSLTLIMEDADAPGGTLAHWLLYNMPAATIQIPERQIAPTGKVGTNDFGRADYEGPCPPEGTHRYYFRLFALVDMLNIPEGTTKEDILDAMREHIIEVAELMGTYTKVNSNNH